MAEHLVPSDSLPALRAEIAGLSRASQRAGGRPIRLLETDIGREGLALVRVEGDNPSVDDWEIVAILHHDRDGTRVEACRPLPRSQLERLSQARALCEACRTVRPRTETWVLRQTSSGRTVQLGSSCVRPFTGGASVDGALQRARALAAASRRLADAASPGLRSQRPGESYIPTTSFLAHAAGAVRDSGYVPASDAEPTWRQALRFVEDGGDPARGDLQRAQAIRAWAADPPSDDRSGYLQRLAACLAQERLSTRELPLAASAVRAFNHHLYWEIRRRKGVRGRPRAGGPNA